MFHTPSGAVVCQGCVAILLVLTGTHQELYSYTIFATWIFLALTAVALVRLRATRPQMPRPYRPLDASGLRKCSFRDLCEPLVGPAVSVIHRTGDYAVRRPILLLLA